MKDASFAGDKKIDQSWLINFENKIVKRTIHLVPDYIETYHLTFMTILWSIGLIGSGFLAVLNIKWLWMSSIFIFLQYVTDLYDGKVGKARNTGLIKWGYYMDHFLDYVFMCSFVVSYYFLVPPVHHIYLIGILALFGAFMVNSFLSFAATNEFKIEFLGFGPTQIRLGFILINTYIIFFGHVYIMNFLPYVFWIGIAVLSFIIFRTQKYIWEIDMSAKNKE